MPAEMYSASGSDAGVQGTTVGGSKPLHRFTKGQPKITGITLLVLGSSFIIFSIATMSDSSESIWAMIPPDSFQGVLFIVCGILYILTDHNLTKKTVTVSLALSVVTILGAGWTTMHILPYIVHSHYYRHYDYFDENTTETEDEVWSSYHTAMVISVEAIFFFYTVVGAIVCIVMSSLAGTALRSTKSQAVIMVTASPTETPVE